MSYIVVLELMLLLLFLMTRLHRRLPFRLWSHVYMIAISYLVLGFAGVFIYGFTDMSLQAKFYWLPVSRSDLVWTLARILGLLCAMCLGSLVYSSVVRPEASPTIRDKAAPSVVTKEGWGPTPTLGMMSLGLALSIIPLFLLLLGAGIANMWSRSAYLTVENRVLLSIGGGLALAGAFACGTFFAAGARRRFRIIQLLSFLIFVSYEAIFFALATRRFAIAPIAFCIGALLVRPRSKWLQSLAGLSLLCAPLLMQFPLLFRGLPQHGLSPYLAYSASNGGLLVHSILDPNQLRGFFLNVFYGLPLTAYVSNSPPLPFSYFLTSVNPLPGTGTNWYQISSLLRVNVYIPFSSLGELLNYGFWLALGLFFLFGNALAAVDRTIRRDLARQNYFLPIVYTGLTIVVILSATQYNLRSSMRVLYYWAALAFLVRMLRLVTPTRQHHLENRP